MSPGVQFTLGWGNFEENMFVYLAAAWIKSFDR